MRTGTPLQNDLIELQNLLFFLVPQIFREAPVLDGTVRLSTGRSTAPASIASYTHCCARAQCRAICAVSLSALLAASSSGQKAGA